jgi:hypothetical protein
VKAGYRTVSSYDCIIITPARWNGNELQWADLDTDMPSLRNLWVNPKTRVVDDDGQTAIVEVDGMLCEWG